jgi:uncharacterized protein YaeQ
MMPVANKTSPPRLRRRRRGGRPTGKRPRRILHAGGCLWSSRGSLSTFQGSADRIDLAFPSKSGQIMAQNATIYKIELSVADMDRQYYETHKLTLAKHPSETEERLMLRLVAFALNAHEHLEMTKGLSADDEPDIWQKSLSGDIDLWVTLGLPSEKVIRKSCGKAAKVVVYPYGGRVAQAWWDKLGTGTARFDNLEVIAFSETDAAALTKLARRAMKLQVNIQDGDVMVSVDETVVYVTPEPWKGAE